LATIAADWHRPSTRANSPAASNRASSSYSKDSNVPDIIALLRPQSTNPVAKPAYVGATIQLLNAAAYTSALATRRPRRPHVSAHAPEGTSKRKELTDQTMNRLDSSATGTPWSRNSKEYTL